jgi:hypothetical protein
MNSYLVEVIEQTHHFITVTAPDEHEALKLAEAQRGEAGQSTAPEWSYKRPRLLENAKG